MDRIIAVTLGIFIVILVGFTSIVCYTGYTENALRSTLTSTYTYNFSLTTDSTLTNLTLYIPVPVDSCGNSPLLVPISSHDLTGLPDGWETELYGTGKATLLKVTAPTLVPPAGTTTKNPYTVTISATAASKTYIDTENPVENSPMFRPVTDLRMKECRDNATVAAGGSCDTYLSSIYAQYLTEPNAEVTVRSSLVGKNTWNIFGPAENEYRTNLYLWMSGYQNGWTPFAGYLEKGIGAPAPKLPWPGVSSPQK